MDVWMDWLDSVFLFCILGILLFNFHFHFHNLLIYRHWWRHAFTTPLSIIIHSSSRHFSSSSGDIFDAPFAPAPAPSPSRRHYRIYAIIDYHFYAYARARAGAAAPHAKHDAAARGHAAPPRHAATIRYDWCAAMIRDDAARYAPPAPHYHYWLSRHLLRHFYFY